ncbi:MAG: hypothetical protein ACFE0J_01110 [Elainellaceae cyanobacterium]
MIAVGWRKVFASVCLSLMLLLTACSAPSAPSYYDQVQEETTGAKATQAVSQDAVQGSNFNQLFPESTDEYEVVPAQEKRGFAEYKLNRDGSTVAMLSVNDTVSNPDAAVKYATTTRQVGGYPAVDIGNTQTAILVAGRFQVKVQSRDESFTQGDREAWIEKFDLAGLAQVQ